MTILQTKLLKFNLPKFRYSYIIILLLHLIITGTVYGYNSVGSLSGLLHVPFGKNGDIAYDFKTGLMNVSENNRVVFSNVFAQVKVDDKLISSNDYTVRNYIKAPITNAFGKGEKYIIK